MPRVAGPPTEPRRAAALERARERHPAAAARFAEVYGFAPSEQLVLLAALFDSLDDAERAAARALGPEPAGVTRWWMLDRVPATRDDLDPRLDFRYATDPPEAVTVLAGGPDGHHVALFHDLPEQPPWLVVHAFARDDGVTTSFTGRGTTVIDGLAVFARRALRDGVACADLLPALQDFAGASAEVVAREHRPKRLRHDVVRVPCLDGVGPRLPDGRPLPAGLPSADERRAQSGVAWMDRAEAELASGSPARALQLGRDLTFLRRGPPDRVTDLLARAYESLGRRAHAEVVRLHARHRDLRSVDLSLPG